MPSEISYDKQAGLLFDTIISGIAKLSHSTMRDAFVRNHFSEAKSKNKMGKMYEVCSKLIRQCILFITFSSMFTLALRYKEYFPF